MRSDNLRYVIFAWIITSACGGDGITYPVIERGSLRQLTFSSETSRDPDWSADGGRIIYLAGSRIASIPSAGGSPEVIYDPGQEGVDLFRPRWRPGTGTGAFAFIQVATGVYSIGLKQGAADPVWVYRTEARVIKSIDFTSDGRYIIFIPGEDILGLGMQKLILSTGEVEQLATEFDGEPLSVSDISVDPDGDHISYYGFLVRGDTGGIFRMLLSGGPSDFFSEPANHPGISEMDDIELSPDGSAYVLVGHITSEKPEENFSNVCLLDRASKELEPLARFPADMRPANPTWSPDGRAIALDYRLDFDSPSNIYVIEF